MAKHGDADVPKLTKRDQDSLIQQLERLWVPYTTKGLEVRLSMGRALNGKLGSPKDRQAHGEAVLKRAAERLDIAESDLSRMRWFAHLFRSVKQMKAAHPELTSWTKVKEAMPRLIAANKGQSVVVKRDGTTAVATAIKKSLDHLIAKLRQKGYRLEEGQREELTDRLKKLSNAAARRLHLKVSFEPA